MIFVFKFHNFEYEDSQLTMIGGGDCFSSETTTPPPSIVSCDISCPTSIISNTKIRTYNGCRGVVVSLQNPPPNIVSCDFRVRNYGIWIRKITTYDGWREGGIVSHQKRQPPPAIHRKLWFFVSNFYTTRLFIKNK